MREVKETRREQPGPPPSRSLKCKYSLVCIEYSSSKCERCKHGNMKRSYYEPCW